MDKDLLDISPHLSSRELEINKLVEKVMSSKQIAEKLFLSVNTVNTHRSNILQRSGKALISDLMYDLKAQGIL